MSENTRPYLASNSWPYLEKKIMKLSFPYIFSEKNDFKKTLFIKDILGESVGQSIRVECEGLGA